MPTDPQPSESQPPEPTTEATTTASSTGPGRAVYGPSAAGADGRVRRPRRSDDRGLRRPVRFGSGADQPAGTGDSDGDRNRNRDRDRDRAGGRDGGPVRALLLDVVREAVGASSRDRLCEAVCERFVDGEPYRFARIDEPTTGTDRLTTLASAGEPPTREVGSGDGGAGEHGPLRALSGRAFRTGDTQRARASGRGRTAGGRDAVSRFAAFGSQDGGQDGDDEAVVAVPLGHGDLVFGVLVVVTAGGGLVPGERRELGVVGEAVGFAFSALRARELLYAERVTAVEFELGGGESFLCRAAAELGCSLRLDSYVETNDGDWLLYVSVSGGDAASFPAVVAEADGVRTVEQIGSRDGGVSVGVRAQTPLLDAVAAVGGVVTSAEMTPSGGRVAVELPGSVDVRRLVGQIRSLYPDASMRSRTTHDRPVSDAPQPSDDTEPGLTDRQREVLEACYRAGYFEWPRESTAEEVADLLGIAAPTLHAHLRKAENALLTAFLDGNDGGNDDDGSGEGSWDGSGDGSGDGVGGSGCIAGP